MSPANEVKVVDCIEELLRTSYFNHTKKVEPRLRELASRGHFTPLGKYRSYHRHMGVRHLLNVCIQRALDFA